MPTMYVCTSNVLLVQIPPRLMVAHLMSSSSPPSWVIKHRDARLYNSGGCTSAMIPNLVFNAEPYNILN